MPSKIYSYFHSNFVKRFYKRISELEDNEEIYYRKHRLIVKVKDEKIRQQLCNSVKLLKDRKERITTPIMIFKIEKYILDNNGGVEEFQVYFNLEKKSSNSSSTHKTQILQRQIEFVNAMKSKGYVLDEAIFENEKCNSISAFLSFFKLVDETAQYTNGCFIKYIHYELTDGGDFDEYYQKIVTDNVIRKVSEYTYSLPVVKMCYNYFTKGDVPENILGILEMEYYYQINGQPHEDYLIASKSSIEANSKKIEENEEYTIYDGNIKIYHNMTSTFENNLKESTNFLERVSKELLVPIDYLIIDFEEKVIGYKFHERQQSFVNVSYIDKNSGQFSILRSISELRNYLSNVRRKLCFLDFEYEYDFDIEKSLVYNKYFDFFQFKFTDIREFSNFLRSSNTALEKQITQLFFKMFLEYINQTYGKMAYEERFLEERDIKFLSPMLAREFINYALGKEVDYEIATSEFLFFDENKVSSHYDTIPHFYDPRFNYDPLKVPFLFDYEAEKKYGFKIEKGTETLLADGRRLVIFKRVRDIAKVKQDEEDLDISIIKKVGYIREQYLKVAEISEIIYSRKISPNDGFYPVVGYVTTPIKGERLSYDVLLKLNNKDLFKVVGYLFSKFTDFYIPMDFIYMDTNFVFYVNPFDADFKVEAVRNLFTDTFTEWIFKTLTKRGYNPNAFVGIEKVRAFTEFANSLDAYCDEHGIYYNSKYKRCPVCRKTKYIVDADFETNKTLIFEDLYAKHYRIDERNNLKVYNPSNINMAEAEATIHSVVNCENGSEVVLWGQECFIPCKKALDDNDKFIGYTYKAVDFNNETGIDVCNDIKEPQKLRNLPRLKSVIRLILQVKEITERGLSFTQNPFTHVFLSKNHKKQVQILNIDFLKKGKAKNTKKWLCEYVCEVIASDSSIEVDLSDCSKNIEAILTKLQDVAEDMTKYCDIHKMFYTKNYLFCPKCIDKAHTENIETEVVKKSQITKLKQFGEGGESIIYRYDNNCVVKVFKEEKINYALKCAVIVRVWGKREALEKINAKNLKYKYILPQKLFVDEETNKFYGYVMDKVSGGKPISILRNTDKIKELGFTKKDVMQILIAVGRGIEILHENNIFIGDLNGQNILFDTHKNVYFLDFDGMGVDEICPEFCTDGYIDPVSKKNKNITMKDDWYSFAVQAFYYLTFTHPFNGIYTIEENGKKFNLETVDKMERRISLLGNHGIKPPTISEPWDWMNEELKIAFLNIFESDNRESIVLYLVNQYKDFHTGIRINPKFVARIRKPFGEKVLSVINHYTAVCEEDDECYVRILVGNSEPKNLYDILFWEELADDYIEIDDYLEINNILLSDDNLLAFVIYNKEVIVVELTTDEIIFSRTITNASNVVVNGRTLYFSENLEGNNIIHQITFTTNEETKEIDIKEDVIKFLPEKETKSFLVKFNSKFVIVKQASNGVDEVYCNSENLCNIHYSSVDTRYNIFYDDVTKIWLVVNSEGTLLFINSSNGDYQTSTLQRNIVDIDDITTINIENIAFNKGNIYVPSKDCLYIINVKDQSNAKKMECNRIMTPDSKLCDFNTNGFSVITNNIFYEVRKG